MGDSIANNRSTLKEFLASIATIQGDLSNITAPPFVLADQSTVELPQYWADHPSLFIAPSHGQSAEERALLILKWFLGSLRNQQYAGRDPSAGVKKPLNAFLGELFLGSFQDEDVGETRLISEQVSHHPPVTACYLWNDKNGIRAEGFTCQEITFSGSVSIKQKGYAIVHIDKFDEDFLIPVPNVKVKGILSGTPYPELTGTYSIVSSTGYISEVKFEGKGFFSGLKNGVEARVFHSDSPDKDVFTVSGQWSHSFKINDQSGKEMESYDVVTNNLPISVEDTANQDPWESRNAWRSVIEALNNGDMKGTSDAKSVVEEGQRGLRKEEQARGDEWKQIFFRRVGNDERFEKLSSLTKDNYDIDPAGGIWRVDTEAIAKATRPYHGDLLPTGERTNNSNADESVPSSEKVSEAQNGAQITHPSKQQERHGAHETDASDRPQDDKEEIEKEKLEKIQIEAFLRSKYSSIER